MTDLNTKFTALEDQLTTQHGEIINSLDTIATALGAPPPGPTTTLADVVTALTQTNTILNGIRSDMNGYLLEIFNTVDAINTNASLNVQRLLATLLQTACPCDADVPLLPPDLGTTPTSATDQAKCQRIQYFIDLYRSWVITIAQYVGNQSSISSFQVNNLLQLTLGNVDITTGELKSGMPTSVRDSIVGQLASAVGSVGATEVDSTLFDAMSTGELEALRQALYGVTNAADGKPAADSAIDGLGLASWAASVLKTMFYSAWPNDIYSDVPAVDASAYDGTICAPLSGCVTIGTTSVTANIGAGDETVGAIVWTSEFSPTATRPDGARVWSATVFTQLPLGTELTLRKVHSADSAVTAHQCNVDGAIISVGEVGPTALPYTVTSAGSGLLVQSGGAVGIEVEICFVPS